MSRFVHRCMALTVCGATSVACLAQENSDQLWVDGIIGKSFASYYMFETELSYQTLLSQQDGWKSFNISPSLDVSPTAHWNFLVGLPLSYTVQTTGYNTFETRVQLGAKYTFTPFKRVQTRLNLRAEERFLKDLQSDEVEQSTRWRLRAEVVVPLDTRNYSADTMWYALTDYELFVAVDRDVKERFVNRDRLRIGLGRKFNYNWRVEAIYTLQQSQSHVSDDDLTTDNIFRLRLKYYFTPRSRKVSAGDNAN